MKNFIQLFVDSAKEFKNLKSLVTASLLVALHTVMACFLSIVVTDSLRISISFIVNCVIGCLFGPVMGLVCGGVGDIIQFVIKPTGPYFIGWTISAAMAGLIYGTMFYHKTPKKKTAVDETTSKAANQILVKLGLTLLPIASIGMLFIAPFAQVIDKKTGMVVTDGTGLQAVTQYVSGGSGSFNAMILAVIGVAISVFLLIGVWTGWERLTMVAAVVGICASILAAYTDKKIMSVGWGFVAMLLLWFVYAVIRALMLAGKKQVDVSFLLLCIITLTFDTLLVNVLIGTYWVSFMYGKGFAFYFASRFIKNMVQLPINIVLTYYVLGFVGRIRKHI